MNTVAWIILTAATALTAATLALHGRAAAADLRAARATEPGRRTRINRDLLRLLINAGRNGGQQQ